MNRPRTVVTGMGIVSPLGCGVLAFWSALCRGEYGIRPVTRFDVSAFPFKQGGEVPNHGPDSGAPGAGPADLATQFMMSAAEEAMADARLTPEPGPLRGAAVVLATNFGGIISGEKLLASMIGKGKAAGSDFAEYDFQKCADCVADRWGFRGPREVLSLSCAAGTAALGHGVSLIRSGRARIVLTGGYDALSLFAWSGLSALRTMTTDKIRPFDKNRAGTIFSEGAGALIIEDLEHAIARGATCHAEVLGFGLNNNAFHMTAPAKQGAGSAAVMKMALEDAGLDPEMIDHVNAHGTGTRDNDVTETQAIKTVFGKHACSMPVNSIKSMTGHMMGAAGSAEAIASILALRNGIVPPTINYVTPDPECDLDFVPNEKRTVNIRTVLSNSAGIGGCNAAVIFAAL